jgi:acyl-CoA thioesterase
VSDGEPAAVREGAGPPVPGPVSGPAAPPGHDDLDDLDGNREALEPLLLTDGLARHLGVEVVGWGGGWARAELRVTEAHTNLAGTAHGGTIFALGDVVFAVSSNSWGRLSVAQTVEVAYLSSVEVGAMLVAESRERHRSQRTGSYLIDVRIREPAAGGQEGPLAASLHALVHRTDRWHLGADAWSEDWRATH